MTERHLVGTSIAFNGHYGNGNGKERQTLDEVLGQRGRRKLLKDLTHIAQAIDTAKEAPETKTRWGYEVPQAAGRTAMQEVEIDPIDIANIGLSEIDPASLTTASTQRLRMASQIILTARGIARDFHEFALQANEAD